MCKASRKKMRLQIRRDTLLIMKCETILKNTFLVLFQSPGNKSIKHVFLKRQTSEIYWEYEKIISAIYIQYFIHQTGEDPG